MPIKHLIARGIGFSPGSVRFVVTAGLSLGAAVPTHTASQPGPVSVAGVTHHTFQMPGLLGTPDVGDWPGWNEPNVICMVKGNAWVPENQEPPGYPERAATAYGAGQMIADRADYARAKFATIGRTFTGYLLTPLGPGDPDSDPAEPANGALHPLCRNPGDAVDTGVIANDVHAPYLAAGITANAADATDFADGFATQLDEYSTLDSPLGMFLDLEEVHDPAVMVDATGVFVTSLTEARFSTEVIDNAGNTLEDLWDAKTNLAGDPFTYDPDEDGGHPDNQDFMNFAWSRLRLNGMAHGLNSTWFAAMRAVVEGLKTGNYENVAGTRAYPFIGRTAQRRFFDLDLTGFTHKIVVCYPFRQSQVNQTGSLLSDWADLLGYELTGDDAYDFGRLSVLRAKARQTSSALADPTRPNAYYIFAPGLTTAITFPSTFVHTWSVEDSVEVGAHGIAVNRANGHDTHLLHFMGGSAGDAVWDGLYQAITLLNETAMGTENAIQLRVLGPSTRRIGVVGPASRSLRVRGPSVRRLGSK